MNTDSDFQIGNTHFICQDYALNGGKIHECSSFDAFAILCDGCSASPDVDIGARMLALAARETLQVGIYNEYQSFGNESIRRASNIFLTYPTLNPQALDATLLITWVSNGVSTTYIYGDGVFFHKSSSGLYAVKVELTSGAPDYLSYNLSVSRKQAYIDFSNKEEEPETKDLRIFNENGEEEKIIQKTFSPVVITRPVKEGDIIAICSDGIGSFRKQDASIPWIELAEEFIGYKNPNGVFVKRRFNALKKKCLKEGITHADDISAAAIIV